MIDLQVPNQLVRDGVVERRCSPDCGDLEYRLLWERLEFQMAHRIAEPELIRDSPREVEDIADYAKLEIMGMLLRLGWLSGGGTRPFRAADQPKQFCLQSLARGKHYWMALFRWEWLFLHRELAELPHHRPNAYYQCLLDISQEA